MGGETVHDFHAVYAHVHPGQGREIVVFVVGDAALLVDPFDIQSIAAGMQRLALEPNLASELVDKGRLRKLLYTWEGSAAQVWNVLTSV